MDMAGPRLRPRGRGPCQHGYRPVALETATRRGTRQSAAARPQSGGVVGDEAVRAARVNGARSLTAWLTTTPLPARVAEGLSSTYRRRDHRSFRRSASSVPANLVSVLPTHPPQFRSGDSTIGETW